MVEVRFAFIGSIEGVKCTLDGEVKYSDAGGFCSFFGVAQGEHTYRAEKAGMRGVSGHDVFMRPLYDSGTTVIEWVPAPEFPFPETEAWVMLFTLEVGEVPPPSKTSILGKIGAIVSSIGFVAVFVDSARRR